MKLTIIGGGPGGYSSGTARTVALTASAIRARNYAAAARAAFCGTAAHMGESKTQGVDLAAIGHGALDLLGFIPGIGAAADVANGLWYAAEGNHVDAAMSFVSAIPGVGDAAGAAKVGAKAGLAALDAADAATATARAAKKLEAAKGVKPPNLSPEGAGRRGAFREAKRSAGLPVSQQPTSVKSATNRAGASIPGREYEFSTPRSDDPEHTTAILEHYGHTYKDDPSQNRGPHFNDPDGNHFDY